MCIYVSFPALRPAGRGEEGADGVPRHYTYSILLIIYYVLIVILVY